MHLRDQQMPPDWPLYVGIISGNRWRRDFEGYWWLFDGYDLWQRANTLKSTSVNGVYIPAAGLLPEPATPGRAPEEISGTGSTSTTHSDGGADDTSRAGGGGGARNSGSPEPAPPNIPPDFAEIPLGPDCCTICHLDDGPLYDGGLCRYCWMLTAVPNRIRLIRWLCMLSGDKEQYSWTAAQAWFYGIAITIVVTGFLAMILIAALYG